MNKESWLDYVDDMKETIKDIEQILGQYTDAGNIDTEYDDDLNYDLKTIIQRTAERL